MGIEIAFPGVQKDEIMMGSEFWAGPSARKFAREFGVDLSQIRGTGQRGRITKEDIGQFIKHSMLARESSSAKVSHGSISFDLLPWPKVDFTKFGEI